MPRLGFFGKLPARGDFLTRAMPPEALSPWEKWLETSMAGAKQQLGKHWMQVYERGPVWRFWIGGQLLGQPLTGAIAPSLDRVGRQFPLSFVLTGAADTLPAAPLAGDGNEPWYEMLDRAALEARHPRFDGDLDGLLDRIPLPTGVRQATGDDQRVAFFAYGEAGLPQLLKDVRDHDHQLTANARSYWWTAGNDFTGPAMVALNGMPDPRGFAALLRGFGPPVRVAAPVVSEAPAAWEEVAIAPVEAPLAAQPDKDMGWAATTPPTEIGDDLRARAAARSAPPAPQAQDASPFDSDGHFLPVDARPAPEPVVFDAVEDDPWAVALAAPAADFDVPIDESELSPTPETSPVSNPWAAPAQARAEPDSDDPPTPETSPVSNPWQSAGQDEEPEQDETPPEPEAAAPEIDTPDAAAADDRSQDVAPDAPSPDDDPDRPDDSDADPAESMPEPDSPDAQTPSAKADLAEVSPPSAPDDEQDLQEDAAAEAEEADTAGPLGISASLDGAAPDPFAALPEEEEDSPFGLPQDTTPKKKSLRGLFSRRGP